MGKELGGVWGKFGRVMGVFGRSWAWVDKINKHIQKPLVFLWFLYIFEERIEPNKRKMQAPQLWNCKF